MSENLLTGIRDVDREIVNKMSDRDFLQMCSLNRTYYGSVCDETYFRIRTEDRFPETIHYKDYVRTRKVRTWKNHYLAIVKYIDLLETEYRYNYQPRDKSPELLYNTLSLYPTFFINGKDQILGLASQDGHLIIVKYLVEQGADIHYNQSQALPLASENGHLTIVKYLVEHGAKVKSNNSEALMFASFNGHLSVVKYLVEQGSDIHAQDDDALRMANENGHLLVVEYLQSLN